MPWKFWNFLFAGDKSVFPHINLFVIAGIAIILFFRMQL